MKNKPFKPRTLSLVPIFLIALSCVSSARVSGPQTSEDKSSLQASDLLPFGRTAVSGARLELISSAAHFGVSFEGLELKISASIAGSQHNYLQYELDGVYQRRLRIASDTVLTIRVTTPGKHTLWLFKATEAHTGSIYIHRVEGVRIQPIPLPNRPVIEFIGNSITCGAASDASEVACGAGPYHDQHNAYMAYGPRVARALNLNFVLSSVSGIGIYRNWNSDGPTMPEVYEKTDFQQSSKRLWDFRTYSPQVVTIALGTNDFSNGDGKQKRLPFDSVTFTQKYIEFVKTVRSKYPTAQVVLLNSPMVSGIRNDILIDCITRVKARIDAGDRNNKPLMIFKFNPMKGQGCTGHPSVEDHERIARELQGFLDQLSWERK